MTTQMNTRQIIGKLMLLGEEESGHAIPEVSSLTPSERQQLLHEATVQKCGITVLELFERWNLNTAENQDLLQLQRQRLATIKKYLQLLTPSMLVLKGPALARYYPRWITRFSSDLDILTEDQLAVTELGRKLIAMGMQQRFASLWIVDSKSRFPLCGSIFFDDATDTTQAASVEIQIGGFPLSTNGIVDFQVFWNYSEHNTGLPGDAATLTPTGQVCLVLTDLTQREKAPNVTIRHIIDLIYLLESRGDRVNWHLVRQFVHQQGTANGINRLFKAAQDSGLFARLMTAGFAIHLPDLGLDAWLHRWSIPRILAQHVRQQRPGSTLATASMHFYRSISLSIRNRLAWLQPLLKISELSFLTDKLSHLGMRMALIPICSIKTNKTYFLNTNGKTFYISPIGVFFITQHGLIENEERGSLFTLFKTALSSTK
jgi:hypothetical protein